MMLMLAAALPLCAQQPPPNPAITETNPVSKTNIPATEPGAACAGNRPELLDYPNLARTAHLQANLVAEVTVTEDGKLKDVKFTTKAAEKPELFENVVREYLRRSNFPPGCEKEPKQLRFEFFFQGEPAEERKSLVEFKAPDTFRISVNPDKDVPLPNDADRRDPQR